MIAALEQAKFYLARQENSYRGFLLSQDPYYVGRIEKHRGNFKKRIAAGAALAAGDSAKLAQFKAVETAADNWLTQVVEAGKVLAADPATRAQAVAMVGPDGLADSLMGPAEDGIAALYDSESAKMERL